MKQSSNENNFLAKIKKPCQVQMKSNSVLASVTAAQAIYESNWGMKDYAKITNNLFRVLIDPSWNGKCYSLETKQMYDSKLDAESNDTLIKVYDSYEQCISDWIQYVVSVRRSENGPFKYRNVIGIKSYDKCIKAYIRDGYLKDHLVDYNDPAYESNMIGLIEKYQLYDWDKEVDAGDVAVMKMKYSVKMAATDRDSLLVTPNIRNAESVASNNRGYKVFDGTNILITDPWVVNENGPMYRVRLSWDNPDSQLTATKILEDAKDEASKHPGYKVYVGEDGTLEYDPWLPPVSEQVDGTVAITPVRVIQIGMRANLCNSAVYRSAQDKNPFMFLTGTYYIYDGKIINGRTRISRTNDPGSINGKNPSVVIGFVNV